MDGARIARPWSKDRSRRCPTGLFARAERLIAERRFDEAISFCQLQLAASPRCVTLRLLAARARLACGDRAGARAELEQALRVDPGNAEARAMWGESIAPAKPAATAVLRAAAP